MLNQGSLKGMTTATAAGRFGTTETAHAGCIRRFKTLKTAAAGCIRRFKTQKTVAAGCIHGFKTLKTAAAGCIHGFKTPKTAAAGCIHGFKTLKTAPEETLSKPRRSPSHRRGERGENKRNNNNKLNINIMKQKTKQLMMTLALLLTAASGAWATVYSGPVSRESLQVGDILVKGAEVTSETPLYGLSPRSYELDGSISNALVIVPVDLPVIGDDGVISEDEGQHNITPYDADNGKDGNAWKVVETGNQEYGVLLAGTTYVAPAPTEWDLTPDETGKVWTLAKMPAGKVMLLAELYAVTGLAWKQDGAKLDEGATVNYCVGFPLNLPTLENPHDLAVTYLSTDQTVATIDEEGVIEIKGVAGETTIKAKFDGDDTYEDKTVTYKLAVTQPLTLTVNQTDHGTVTVEGLTGGISITAEDKGKVICTDGSIFATAEQANNSSKSPAAIIVGIDTQNNKGLAIALWDYGDGGSWTNASEACNSLNQSFSVNGGTWLLPSVAQWKATFKAFGDNEFSSTTLNEFINTAGETLHTHADGIWYWSTDDEAEEGKAHCLILTTSEGPNVTYNITDKSNTCHVRPFLTFNLATVNVIATETTGEYIVIPGTSVNLKAEADEGYNVAGWKNGTTAVSEGVTYDDYLDEENSRMPATSTLVLPLSANATISAQFTENEYNVTFLAQNKFNIKGGGAKVLVDNTDKTDDLDHNNDGSESKLGVKYGKTVKISTNEGYKLRKVEAKKKEASETKIMVDGVLLNYAVGDTWSAIVQKNPGVISISDNSIMHGNKTLIKGNDVVSPNEPYYPNANYHWEGLW